MKAAILTDCCCLCLLCVPEWKCAMVVLEESLFSVFDNWSTKVLHLDLTTDFFFFSRLVASLVEAIIDASP